VIEVVAATWAAYREVNEDFCAVDQDRIILCDGAGGVVTGVVAARLAALALSCSLEGDPPPFADAMRAAHQLIADAAAAEALPRDALARWVESRLDDRTCSIINGAPARLTLRGMFASTLACVIRGGKIWLAQLGNVRAWRLRKQSFELLTPDHSLAPQYPSVVTRSLGLAFHEPEVRCEPLLAGDRFLFCTDGLHHFADEATMASLLESGSPVEAFRDAVPEGRDNIGVVLIRVGDPRSALAAKVHNDPPW
jgi:protein phosphatase